MGFFVAPHKQGRATIDIARSPITIRFILSTASGGSPALAASYVYGRYVDEVLTMRRGGNDYYHHGDDMHNVVKQKWPPDSGQCGKCISLSILPKKEIRECEVNDGIMPLL